jgi:hypothetical protein
MKRRWLHRAACTAPAPASRGTALRLQSPVGTAVGRRLAAREIDKPSPIRSVDVGRAR